MFHRKTQNPAQSANPNTEHGAPYYPDDLAGFSHSPMKSAPPRPFSPKPRASVSYKNISPVPRASAPRQRFPNMPRASIPQSGLSASRAESCKLNSPDRLTYEKSDILSILECPICMENYDSSNRIPRMLPCAHTICFICLGGIAKQSLNMIVNCPTCRRDHHLGVDGIDKLPVNPTLLALIDVIPLKSCSECKDMKKLIKCCHCNKTLCKGCIQRHQEAMKNELKVLSKQLARFIPDTEAGISKAQEHVRLGIKETMETARDTICQHFDHLIRVLQTRKEHLVQQVDMDEIAHDDVVANVFLPYKEILQSAGTCKEWLDNALQNDDSELKPNDLLEMQKQCTLMERRVQNMYNESLSISICELDIEGCLNADDLADIGNLVTVKTRFSLKDCFSQECHAPYSRYTLLSLARSPAALIKPKFKVFVDIISERPVTHTEPQLREGPIEASFTQIPSGFTEWEEGVGFKKIPFEVISRSAPNDP